MHFISWYANTVRDWCYAACRKLNTDWILFAKANRCQYAFMGHQITKAMLKVIKIDVSIDENITIYRTQWWLQSWGYGLIEWTYQMFLGVQLHYKWVFMWWNKLLLLLSWKLKNRSSAEINKFKLCPTEVTAAWAICMQNHNWRTKAPQPLLGINDRDCILG